MDTPDLLYTPIQLVGIAALLVGGYILCAAGTMALITLVLKGTNGKNKDRQESSRSL